MSVLLSERAAELVSLLKLVPHPEGGHYREIFRSRRIVQPDDGRPSRIALTSIDFLLAAGEFSAWHKVRSDELWHCLEGAPLRLWIAPPTLDRFDSVELGSASATRAPRQVVPAGWWQAAEPTGDFTYCGATVGPGFEFSDFSFARDDVRVVSALQRVAPALMRLL